MNDLEKMKALYDELNIKYEINVYGLLSYTYQSLFLDYSNVSFNFDKDGKYLEIDICE